MANRATTDRYYLYRLGLKMQIWMWKWAGLSKQSVNALILKRYRCHVRWLDVVRWKKLINVGRYHCWQKKSAAAEQAALALLSIILLNSQPYVLVDGGCEGSNTFNKKKIACSFYYDGGRTKMVLLANWLVLLILCHFSFFKKRNCVTVVARTVIMVLQSEAQGDPLVLQHADCNFQLL